MDHNVNREIKNVFEQFMKIKFPHVNVEDIYYKEWMERFEVGMEWQRADYNGRLILKSLAPDVYPNDKDEFFIRKI